MFKRKQRGRTSTSQKKISELEKKMETMFSFEEIERALLILLDMARQDKAAK